MQISVIIQLFRYACISHIFVNNKDEGNREFTQYTGSGSKFIHYPTIGVFHPGIRTFTRSSFVSEPFITSVYFGMGRPLQSGPHVKQKMLHCLPYTSYLYKISYQIGMKTYMLTNDDHIKPT